MKYYELKDQDSFMSTNNIGLIIIRIKHGEVIH